MSGSSARSCTARLRTASLGVEAWAVSTAILVTRVDMQQLYSCAIHRSYGVRGKRRNFAAHPVAPIDPTAAGASGESGRSCKIVARVRGTVHALIVHAKDGASRIAAQPVPGGIYFRRHRKIINFIAISMQHSLTVVLAAGYRPRSRSVTTHYSGSIDMGHCSGAAASCLVRLRCSRLSRFAKRRRPYPIATGLVRN